MSLFYNLQAQESKLSSPETSWAPFYKDVALEKSTSEKLTNSKSDDERLQVIQNTAKLLGRDFESIEDLKLWGVLGDQLDRARIAYEKGEKGWAKFAGIPKEFIEGDSIYLTISDSENSERKLSDVVRSYGAIVMHELNDHEIELKLPVSQLAAIASVVEGVSLVHMTQNTAPTPAWIGTNARWWQLTGRVTGDGGPGGSPVTIAIVDSFAPDYFRALESAGLIPRNTVITQDLAPYSHDDDHGNIMLALMYEIAPKARYLLINSVPTAGGLSDAINAARSLQPDILSLSLISPIDRYSGSSNAVPGPVMKAQNSAAGADILVVASAGNHGAAGAHWSGQFTSSTRYHGFLNWNTNTAVSPTGDLGASDLPAVSNVAGERIVNDLGCLGASPGFRRPLKAYVGLPIPDSRYYNVVLMKYEASSRGWFPVVSDGVRDDSQRHFSYYLDPPNETVRGTVFSADIPTTDCGAGFARYGLSITRTDAIDGHRFLNDDDPENYINVFYDGNGTNIGLMQVYNTSASLGESNTSENVVTVGGAYCTAPMNQGCPVDGTLAISGRGPAVRDAVKPLALPAEFLTSVSRDPMNLQAVKPDFVAPSPNFMGEMALQSGTSGSTAITAGMAALLLDRYPMFRRNPSELKSALVRLAGRSVGLQSTYVRLADSPSDPRYYETKASYRYGRGYLKLEKESYAQMRGRPNHVRLGRNMTSSPREASTINGSQSYLEESRYPANMTENIRFGDGLGPTPTAYLVGDTGGIPQNTADQIGYNQSYPTRLLFPVLKPVFVFDPVSFGGAGRALGATFSNGNMSTQLMPSASIWVSSISQFNQFAGYFRFPSLRFDTNPTASPNIGQGFSLTMRAVRRDGSPVPTDSTQATNAYNTALMAAQTRMRMDGTPIDPLTLGCPDCFVRQNNTADFNTCRVDYNPAAMDTCPIR